MQKIIRQGDVLLVRVAKVPAKAAEVAVEGGRVVLAHGEVTGHAHAIYEPAKAKLWSADAERFLQVMETVALQHEEHAAANLAPGVYRVAIQTEYTPQALRNVAD
jgi:hypothetical protein